MIIEDFYKSREPRVFNEIAPTLRAEREGLKVLETAKSTHENGYESVIEKQCVAMRGRGENNEQKLEPNNQGVDNALTTVQKDNLIMEKKIQKVGQISNEGSQCGTVVSEKGLFPTISAGTHGYANAHIQTRYRIRKLTPKECWRLMGYTDADFEKAATVNSNTQLYKEAGNAIIKQVLMAIFSKMNLKKKEESK